MIEPEIILHIGLPKTGSTALQESMRKNDFILKSKGIYTIHSAYNISTFTLKSYIERQLKLLLLEHKDCKKIVFSDETLCAGIPWVHEFIKERLFGYNFKAVCYLRRQDLFCESFYTQRLQVPLEGKSYPFSLYEECFNNNMYCNYLEFLNKWADTIGKENVIVRPYEKIQMPKGTIYDFYTNCLGFNDEEYDRLEKPEETNPSMCRDLAEFQIKSELLHLTPFFMNNIQGLLEENDFKLKNVYLDYEQRKALLKKYEKMNAQVAQEYLGREDGKLFLEEPEDLPPYKGLTPQKARKIGKQILILIKPSHSQEYKKLDEMETTDEITKFTRKLYYNANSSNVPTLLTYRLADIIISKSISQQKKVLLYGVAQGKMGEEILEAALTYSGTRRVLISDKSLEKRRFYYKRRKSVLYVIDFDEIEEFAPDVIIIGAAQSGPSIMRSLKKLNLPNTEIYPFYDMGDSIFDSELNLNKARFNIDTTVMDCSLQWIPIEL